MSRNFLRDPKWVGVVIDKIMKCNFFQVKRIKIHWTEATRILCKLFSRFS